MIVHPEEIIQRMETFFAVCQPGLESVLSNEIADLGLAANLTEGGVEFNGTITDALRANLYLRTASRVLLRLGSFTASGFPELRRKAGRLPWGRFIRPGQGVDIRVTCRKSRLYHSGAVAERVSGAIGDQLGQAVSVGGTENEQAAFVRLLRNQCTISIDTSGEPLHRRGYRQAVVKAPLRETLAAAMVLASGWDRKSPFMDPFCGSGTIAIEAALLAAQLPPGKDRAFALMNWPDSDSEALEPIRKDAKNAEQMPLILASDRDAGAIQRAKENAERAGVADYIQFSCRSLSAIEPPAESGVIVTNPPYGVRISTGKDLRDLYAAIGNVMRKQCAGWQFVLLVQDENLMRSTGLDYEPGPWLDNGGIKVRMAKRLG